MSHAISSLRSIEQGTSENPQDPSQQAPAPETANDYVSKAELAQIVSQAVNSAVTAHLKRALPKALEQFAPKASPQDAPSEAPGAPGEAASAPAWQRDIDTLKRQLAEERKLRKDTAQKAASERASSELSRELQSSGRLRPEAMPTVLDLLTKAQNRIAISEDGQASYRLNDDGETVSLAEGARAFLASKEAALFMPAPTPKNSHPGSRAPIANQAGSQEDPQAAARKALIDLL